MIAVDTSTWIAFFEGRRGDDVDLLERALSDRQAALPAPVLSELLSEPERPQQLVDLLEQLPLLEPEPGFWHRAGLLRSRVLRAGRKARLADALISQICLDHDVRLITRDRDFRAFATVAARELVLP